MTFWNDESQWHCIVSDQGEKKLDLKSLNKRHWITWTPKTRLSWIWCMCFYHDVLLECISIDRKVFQHLTSFSTFFSSRSLCCETLSADLFHNNAGDFIRSARRSENLVEKLVATTPRWKDRHVPIEMYQTSELMTWPWKRKSLKEPYIIYEHYLVYHLISWPFSISTEGICIVDFETSSALCEGLHLDISPGQAPGSWVGFVGPCDMPWSISYRSYQADLQLAVEPWGLPETNDNKLTFGQGLKRVLPLFSFRKWNHGDVQRCGKAWTSPWICATRSCLGTKTRS